MIKIITVAAVSLVAGFLLSTLVTVDNKADNSSDAAAKLAVAEAMIKAWDTQNWHGVADLFTEDGVLHSMMLDPVVGREAIRARIVNLGAGVESITLQIRNKGVINNVVILERLDEFVYNGHAGTVPVVGVMEIDNGLIKEWREYYDHQELMKGMGLAPEVATEDTIDSLGDNKVMQ